MPAKVVYSRGVNGRARRYIWSASLPFSVCPFFVSRSKARLLTEMILTESASESAELME